MVYLLLYVPNMGAILKSAILTLSNFFNGKGSCDISYNIRIFYQFIPVNRFEVAVMVQKLQHILLQITEDGFDQGGEN